MRIRIVGGGVFTLVVCLLITLFSQSAPTKTAQADDSVKAKPQPVEESMHEFMEYVFQPTYKRLRAAMASEPADKAGWKAIKSDSLILAEGANLLLIRTPKEKADQWSSASVAVRKLGGELYKSAAAKDYAAARKNYAAMLKNCNQCHKVFAEGKYQLQP